MAAVERLEFELDWDSDMLQSQIPQDVDVEADVFSSIERTRLALARRAHA